MKVRVGIDLVRVDRFTRLAAENPGILETIFTGQELSHCLGRRRTYEHLAARFAAKEAVLKALGTGLGQRMAWTEVEIVNDASGRPRVRLSGGVEAWVRRHRIEDVEVSMSHVPDLAIAQVVAVDREP
jgi:holo-[acyl-carrier protein] synthase